MLDFIDALGPPARARHRLRGDVSGIGPDVEPAKARAAGWTSASRIRFTGYADYDAVPALYREADIFVSPTYAEGFSNTILEAMASGLAVRLVPLRSACRIACATARTRS